MVTLFMVNSCLDITYTIHIIWLYHDIIYGHTPVTVVILCLHNSSMVVPIVIHSLVITSIAIVLQALLPLPFLVCDAVWCSVVQCSAVWVWLCVFGIGWGRGWWRVVLEFVLECNVM